MIFRNKYIFISACVVIIAPLVIGIAAFVFLCTDLIRDPKYIVASSYNNHYNGCNIVEVDSIYSLDVDKIDPVFFKSNIKYCKNLSELTIGPGDFKNVNFVNELNGIDTLITVCKSNDWSGISGCKKATFISLISSDFSDLSLFSGFSELSELKIQSDKKMSYSGFETLTSLQKLGLAVGNVDIKEISEAVQIKELTFDFLNEITNVDYLLKMNDLEKISLGSCQINEESLCVISKINNLKEVGFYNCSFLCDEKTVQKYLSVISEKGTDVQTDEHNTYSDSEDK